MTEKLLRCRKQTAIQECVQSMFVWSTDRNHLGHVALRAGVLGRILHPHQNQEVKVVPHAVF